MDASLELRMHPHIIVSPHLGASTYDAQVTIIPALHSDDWLLIIYNSISQERVAKAVAVNMSDIFDGGSFTGVVNSPDLGAVAKQEHIVPYVLLAEKIGSIQGQLLKGNKINSITVNLRGKDIADAKITDVIRSAVIKGLKEILI